MNSMTGFGRDAAQTDRYNILVEISGVNRKQTEIAVNVPRGYAEWDASVRSIVQGAVSRGRVGVSISVERLEEADGSLQLDEQKLASLAELLNRASDLTGQPLPLQASDLLRLDIVTSAAEASLSPEEAWPMVEKALKAALKDFISMRAAEGANLKADVLGKLDVLEQFRLRIAEHAPSVPVRLREAMLKRLADADLSVSADDERIIREVALFADKCDISEPCAVPPLLRAGLWISFARKSSGNSTPSAPRRTIPRWPIWLWLPRRSWRRSGNRFRTSNDSHETAIGNIAGGIRAFRFREDDVVPPRDGKRSVRVQHFLHDAPAQTRGSQWGGLPFPDSRRI